MYDILTIFICFFYKYLVAFLSQKSQKELDKKIEQIKPNEPPIVNQETEVLKNRKVEI